MSPLSLQHEKTERKPTSIFGPMEELRSRDKLPPPNWESHKPRESQLRFPYPEQMLLEPYWWEHLGGDFDKFLETECELA